ncbi:hypothetical protein Vretimale_10481 [Volvox reticuliferus]|uniref:Uncharacterized protein n=1 Tax=Volvox reticuliferus TaxID=1737510 RepID=A0A8J4GFK2_9CHLO|nr:hypothetical protein Vretifemale_12501 [Volvox reticuliferus]GIM06210.1 hypothetical protein Vretimale_10481 [Volvox reticuliferus]
MLQALKDFQIQRFNDLVALAEIAQTAWKQQRLPACDDVPKSAQYTAMGILVAAQLVMILLSSRGRRIIFLTVDTVLAVLLVGILLVAILSLPFGAAYIGLRGSIMMARSLAENFTALGLVLRPLLALIGQAAVAPTGSGGGGGTTDPAAGRS